MITEIQRFECKIIFMKIANSCVFVLFWTVFCCFSFSAEVCIQEYLIEIKETTASSGMNCVDCVYVINLENRKERWQNTNVALNSYGIYPIRVNAINGWNLTEQDKENLLGPYPDRMRGGQIGCLLSHLSVIRDAYEREYQCIWVCEDDIKIIENPHQLSDIIEKLNTLDPCWDILYTDVDAKNSKGERIPSLMSDFRLDQIYFPIEYYRQRIKVNEDISEIKQRFGAHSMIVSKRGIEKILNYFTKLYLWTAYDIDIHYIPCIKQYALNRDLVSVDYTLGSDTELCTNNFKSWEFDKEAP